MNASGSYCYGAGNKSVTGENGDGTDWTGVTVDLARMCLRLKQDVNIQGKADRCVLQCLQLMPKNTSVRQVKQLFPKIHPAPISEARRCLP